MCLCAMYLFGATCKRHFYFSSYMLLEDVCISFHKLIQNNRHSGQHGLRSLIMVQHSTDVPPASTYYFIHTYLQLLFILCCRLHSGSVFNQNRNQNVICFGEAPININQDCCCFVCCFVFQPSIHRLLLAAGGEARLYQEIWNIYGNSDPDNRSLLCPIDTITR